MYGGNIMTTRLFHEQLRYERDKRGWSQADLGEKPGNIQVGKSSRHEGQAQGPHLSALPPLVPTTSTMDAPSEPSSLEEAIAGKRVALAYLRADWGEAPSIVNLYGRDEGCARLKRWIEEDHCRMVAVLGMG